MNSATPTDPGATAARAILLLVLASFVGAANLRVCDALLPQIAAELGVTVGSAATMVTAFAVAYGVCQIVVGPLGNARGKLLMVVLGSLWAGIATIVCAAMPSLAPLVLFRFLAGAGAAAVIPLDRLDRRRGSLRAPASAAGTLHLRSNPRHRLRPGGGWG